jgi:hypothetical protein
MAYVSITGIMDFVLRLVFQTQQNISESGSVSILRWKGWEVLNLVTQKELGLARILGDG